MGVGGAISDGMLTQKKERCEGLGGRSSHDDRIMAMIVAIHPVPTMVHGRWVVPIGCLRLVLG
jgi:hypothetical protein